MDETLFHSLTSKADAEDIDRFVVGAVIINDSRVLLLERPKSDFMGGIYELPSGKVEGGETLDVALAREVKEETGLEISEITEYMGHFDYLSKSGKKTRQFNFAATIRVPIEISLTEHENYAWAQQKELSRYPVTKSVRQVLEKFWGERNQ